MKTSTLLKTAHGSHLYGLAHEQSDNDIYEIYDFNYKIFRPHKRKQSRQKITDDMDLMSVSLDRFEHLCYSGVPQAIEALYSPEKDWIEHHEHWPEISDEIKFHVVNTHINDVMKTYKRTAWNFMKNDDFKKNRHAMRLCLNAHDLLTYGTFTPRLMDSDIKAINELANLPVKYRLLEFRENYFSVFDRTE